MNNVLLAPTIKKNLLSVRHLCKDSPVKVVFDDKFISIKDRETDEVLVTDGVKEGLWYVELKDTSSANLVEKPTLSLA